MTAMILFCLLLLFPLVISYTDEAINLLVRSPSRSNIRRYCIELAKLPNGLSINITDFTWRKPYLSLSSVSACDQSNLNNSLPSVFPPNTMLIVYEHECTMTEQAWNVENRFGPQISVMIITQRTNTRYELTYNTTAMPVSIPVVIFWEDDFNKMSNTYNNLANIELSIDYPPIVPKKFRPAILLMFLLVLLVLLAGNFWAADEFKRKVKDENPNTTNQPTAVSNERAPSYIKIKRNSTAPSQIIIRQNSIVPEETSQQNQPALIPINCCVIITIICFAVGWLLLLYFFPKVMIYILQAMFCIGGFISLTKCLNRLSYFVPLLRRYQTPSHQFRKPCTCKLGSLSICTIFAMAVSLTLVIIWYIYRLTDWAWVLQDILGAAICISILSVYRLGNMRVITVILIAFLLYDIFFVFVTPYIPFFQSSNSVPTTTAAPLNGSSSSSGQSISRQPTRNPSVMEQVALGIGTNGETVPLLFALPLFIPESELDPCVTLRKSMLGFGDVILPGVLLTFCKIFDIASANRWSIYYIQSIISYFVGFAITHIALYFMETAQPALLYLVPCILLSTIITGLCRRELKELYTGKRIDSFLNGTTRKPALTSSNGVDNPIGQQTNDELPVDERTGDEYY